MLHNTEVEVPATGGVQVAEKSNLLIELIAFLSSQMAAMEQHTMDQNEFAMVESVLTLFAKVLK